MEKNKLRKETLALLKSKDKSEKASYDEALAERFFALPIYQKAKAIALYLSFDFEYNTQLLLDRALADGKQVLVPKTYPQGKMDFVIYDKDRLEKTSFGLWEPISDKAVPKSSIDVIVVPGVVFNDQGYRIGYGAGYYDRYLADYTGETVSFIYPEQLRHFQADAHDIPVKGLLHAERKRLL